MIQEITRIPLEGVHNTRDLGGYRTIDGRSIRPHCLIRSGELSKLTEKDKEILLEEYKLSAVVDFRTGAEQRENPDPVLEGVTYISNPILEEQALGITREQKADKDVVGMVLQQMKGNDSAGAEHMESMYENLVTNTFCRKQYAGFFSVLLNQESGSVLWHCTAGKDRVGTGTALLLEALGIPREQIMADYLKVNEFLAEGINRTVTALMEKTGDAMLAEQLRILFSVQESYLQKVYTTVEEGYGSVTRYLEEEMGIGKDGINTLRQKYLI